MFLLSLASWSLPYHRDCAIAGAQSMGSTSLARASLEAGADMQCRSLRRVAAWREARLHPAKALCALASRKPKSREGGLTSLSVAAPRRRSSRPPASGWLTGRSPGFYLCRSPHALLPPASSLFVSDEEIVHLSLRLPGWPHPLAPSKPLARVEDTRSSHGSTLRVAAR